MKKLISILLLVSICFTLCLSGCGDDTPENDDDGTNDEQNDDELLDSNGRPALYNDFGIYIHELNNEYFDPFKSKSNIFLEHNQTFTVKYVIYNRKLLTESRSIDNVEYSLKIEECRFGKIIRYEIEYGTEVVKSSMGNVNECYIYTSFITIEVKPNVNLMPENPKYDDIIYGYINFAINAKNLDVEDGENETESEYFQSKNGYITFLVTPYTVIFNGGLSKNGLYYPYLWYLGDNNIVSEDKYKTINRYLSKNEVIKAFPDAIR